MAQSSHGWHGHSFPNGIASLSGPGGIPSGGDVGFDHLEDFQQYSTEHPQFDDPQPNNQYLDPTSFNIYHPAHPTEHFPGNTFVGGDLPEQPTYYQNNSRFNNIISNVNNNGSGLHGHGTPNLQPFTESQFHSSGPRFDHSFQNQLHQRYIEQPSQSHTHSPSSFGVPSWQGPAHFDQGTVGYEDNSQLIYQQAQQVATYPVGQRSANSYGPGSALGRFGAQILQYQNRPAGDDRAQPLQGIAPPAHQGFGRGSQPSEASVELLRGPGTAPQNSSVTGIMGPSMARDAPQAPAQQSWVNPEGCPFLLVKNAPRTKISTFGALAAPTKGGEKPFVAKHDTHVKRLLPERNYRLPCELQKELEELNKLKGGSIPPVEKNRIASEITQLHNEPVIVVDSKGSESGYQETNPKSIPKRKMDSGKKSESPSSGNNKEHPNTSLARAILRGLRPTQGPKALEYEIIQKVWLDPTEEFSNEKVKENIDKFNRVVLARCAEIKTLKAQLKAAENATTKEDVPQHNSNPEREPKKSPQSLLDSLESQYDELCIILEAALKFGDEFTLTQLGINTKLVPSLCNITLSLFKDSPENCNSSLSKAILKLLSLLVTVDTKTWINSKMDRQQQRVRSHMDEDVAACFNQIFENGRKRSEVNARAASEAASEASNDVANGAASGAAKKNDDVKKDGTGIPKKVSASTKDSPSTSKASPLKKEIPLKKPGTEIRKMQPIDYSGLGSAKKKSNPSPAPKRTRDDDVDTRAPKKAAVENAVGAPSTAQTPPTTTPTSSQAPSAGIVQARARPSGSMLPGRSRMPPRTPPRRPAPQLPPSSTIGNLLQQIENPPEPPRRSEEPARPPETPEEAARRERRESRRHLRVSWKSGDELTDIRIFEHDMAEDKGRDHNMLRDARDNRSEGQMFKQRIRDDDDDYEEQPPKEHSLQEWKEPTPVEVKRISEEQMKKNFETRGGTRPVESEQKKYMEDYEKRVLMAIYTSMSEVPHTPMSPPTGRRVDVAPQPAIQVVPSNPAKWQEYLPVTNAKRSEIHQRWSDYINSGFLVAHSRALHRFHSARRLPAPPNPGNSVIMSRPRTEQERAQEVLDLLKSDKVKNYVDPTPYDPANPKTQRRHDYVDPKVQRDADALENVFAKFANQPFPPTQPPQYLQSNPERVMEWYDGHNRDIQTKANQQQQAQLQQYQQPQHQVQVPTQSQPPKELPASEIWNILGKVNALKASQSTAQAFQPVPPPAPQPQQVITTPSISPADRATINSALALFPFLSQQPQAQGQAQGQAQAPSAAAPNLQETLALLQQNSTPNPAQPAAPAHWQGWPQAQPQPQTQSQPQTSQGYGGYGYNAQSFGAHPQSSQLQGIPGIMPFGSQAQSSQSQSMQMQGVQNQRDNNDRGNRKDFHRGTKDHKGINRSLIGTKACTFWARGQCAKGDQCTFRHDPNDLK